jgi:hypothetical protein
MKQKHLMEIAQRFSAELSGANRQVLNRTAEPFFRPYRDSRELFGPCIPSLERLGYFQSRGGKFLREKSGNLENVH